MAVELGLSPQEPPPALHHGTASRFVESIQREGLKPQHRQQVHPSLDEVTTHRVGQRHGEPLIFMVDTMHMHAQGFAFYLADNGVWLTDHVSPQFLTLLEAATER